MWVLIPHFSDKKRLRVFHCAPPRQDQLGLEYTKALKAIAVVHSFFALESEGNLN
jgi:hypothetical protein